MPTTPSGPRPRLCFLGYRHLREFSAPVIAEYHDRADIELIDATVHDTIAYAQERIRHGGVDAFISGGANGGLLRQQVRAPVATMQLGGLDVLQALIRVRHLSPRVGVIVYGQTLPELDAIHDLLNIELEQRAYLTPTEARRHFDELHGAGFPVIVGTSLAVEMAEAAGLVGVMAYSLDSIRRGFDEAIELVRVARMEADRYAQLNGVLHTLEHAVLAVDRSNQVIAANPPMQRVLGAGGGSLLGRDLALLDNDLSLQGTLDSGATERARVLTIGGRHWVANRTPIRVNGEICGAAMTLYDAIAIHEADNSLRMQQRRQQTSARHRFDDLEGASPDFVRAVDAARRFARTDLTVLISGESGTGKELFAQAIHNESPRAGKPFVAVNCAALPESLLESELFGYEEGAFTGARRGGKRGLFEAAHSGTVFLDEIGDMPLSLQTRLLRVLQEREVVRVGSASPIPVDLRVIAATHQPLADMVAQGRFRQDLFFRINTLRLGLPALRDRPADVMPMVEHRVRRNLSRLGVEAPRDALRPVRALLQGYTWPGNVRELENVCERLAVFMAQFPAAGTVDWSGLAYECPELFEAARIEAPEAEQGADDDRGARARAVLARHFGNHQAAARAMGVSRSTLWRWLRTTGPL
ncbi:propionate catabolism operon regulatory protein PrpR [Xylophilus sp. GOD-11R]|nr:propionate catabolism operon regulatory protein PrpR [Xylophilus sp. GOD-11R]WPB59473.1 propionate catabolism operon regulatory protein PrpR [Xylophilus sp. GOD-11R]